MTPTRVALALAGAALLAVLLRLPFVWAGIGPDEGGYAFIAHQWAGGAPLYDAVWVDRPQGLLLLFRAITDVAYAPWAIRAAAVLAGATLTILLGLIGGMLHSRRAGITAAVLYAVIGVGPGIEGFTMNAELAGAVPATAAVACVLRWWMVGASRWLLAAGALGATGILMKQSGFDGLAIGLLLAAGAAGTPLERVRRAGLVLGGAAIPLGLAAIHGLELGWSRYWFAVYGWRAHEGLGLTFGHRMHLLSTAMPRVAGDLWSPALTAALGLVACVRRRGVVWIAALWLLVAFMGVNVGGWYWPHYFVQMVPPLALLAAFGICALQTRSPAGAVALGCAALAPVSLTLAHLGTVASRQRDGEISYALSFKTDQRLARFVREHSSQRDTFYAIASRADLYFLSRRQAPIPFLWSHSPLLRRSTLVELLLDLSGAGRPKFIAVTQPPREVDRTGQLQKILDTYYTAVEPPPGRGLPPLLIARGATLAPTPPRIPPTRTRVTP